VSRLLHLGSVGPIRDYGTQWIMNDMDYSSCYRARRVWLPDCCTWSLLFGELGVNVLIEMPCRCQMFQMDFQLGTIFGHMTRVLMIIAVEFRVSQVWVSDQLWRPNEERFPLNLLYEPVDRFLKDRFEGPKRRGSKICRTGQAFHSGTEPSRRLRCDNLGLCICLDRRCSTTVLLDTNKLINFVHQFRDSRGDTLG
jgi:hypothetical protein